MLRERAELDNQRKRLQRDLEQARKFANEKPAERTAAAVRQPGARPGRRSAATCSLREGIELTLRQLHRIAESNGLVEVAPARRQPFDPERHQAMSMVDGRAASRVRSPAVPEGLRAERSPAAAGAGAVVKAPGA